jgi:hypothetical protein
MKKSHIFWIVYLIIAVITAIYGNIWGEMHHKGFFYNLGRGLIWPTIIFPALGKAIGTIVILAFVAFIAFKKN